MHNYVLRDGRPLLEVPSGGGPKDTPSTPELVHDIRHIDHVIARSPMPETVEAHRSLLRVSFMDTELAHEGRPTLKQLKALVGTVQTDRGYMSTTLGAGTLDIGNWSLRHRYRLHLTIPAGKNAFWYGKTSLDPRQRELLLERDTFYRINGVAEDDQAIHIHADVLLVPPGAGALTVLTPASAAGPPVSGRAWTKLGDGTYQWGRYGFAQAMVRVKGSDGAVWILLQRSSFLSHMNGLWALPGQAVNRGEDFYDAAWRGITEETNLDRSRFNAVPKQTHTRDLHGWRHTTYIIDVGDNTGPIIPKARNKGTHFQWVRLQDLARVDLHPHFHELARAVREGRTEPYTAPPVTGTANTVNLTAATVRLPDTLASEQDLRTRAATVRGEALQYQDRATEALIWTTRAEQTGTTDETRKRLIAEAGNAGRNYTRLAHRFHKAADALEDAAEAALRDPGSARTAAATAHAEQLYNNIRPLLAHANSDTDLTINLARIGPEPTHDDPAPHPGSGAPDQVQQPPPEVAATPDLRPGSVDPSGVRSFDDDGEAEEYGDDFLDDPRTNPHAFTTLTGEQQNAVTEYTKHSWPYNTVLREGWDQRSRERLLQAWIADRGDGWPLYEMTGLAPVTLADVERAAHRTDLPREQAALVHEIQASASPETALHLWKARAGDAGELVEVFGGLPSLADIERRIALIDQALDRPLPEAVVVHRGVDSIDFMDRFDPENLQDLVGSRQTEYGYMSTTLGRGTAFPGAPQWSAHLHLTLPSGTRGLWVGTNSAHPHQRELLLARDTDYTVTKVAEEDGDLRIHAEVQVSADGTGSPGAGSLSPASLPDLDSLDPDLLDRLASDSDDALTVGLVRVPDLAAAGSRGPGPVPPAEDLDARTRLVEQAAESAEERVDELNGLLGLARGTGRRALVDDAAELVRNAVPRARRLREAADALRRAADLARNGSGGAQAAASRERAEELYRGVERLLVPLPLPPTAQERDLTVHLARTGTDGSEGSGSSGPTPRPTGTAPAENARSDDAPSLEQRFSEALQVHVDSGRPEARASDAPGSGTAVVEGPGANRESDPWPGRVGPDGIRRFGTDDEAEAYGEHVLGDPGTNPHSFGNLTGEERTAVLGYTTSAVPYNSLMRIANRQDREDLMEQWLYTRGPLWPLYEMTGFTPLTLESVAEGYERFTSLPREQAALVQEIMESADPAWALQQMKTWRWTHSTILIESFGALPTFEEIEHRIDLINRVIARNPLPERITVHRVLYEINFMRGFTPEDPHALVGQIQREPAFLSTSLGVGTPFGSGRFPFELHLTLPPGTGGLWLGKHSVYPDQRELLLQHGTEYQVTAVTERDGVTHIDVEVLAPAPGEPSGGDGTRSAPAEDAPVSGDGWVRVPDSTYRWGLYGAAGLLLYSDGPDGTVPHVLLQHRGSDTDAGDTWSVPGGARDRDETPLQAARREFSEEVTGDPGAIEVVGTHTHDLTSWRYDTYLARVPGFPDLGRSNEESRQIRWIPVQEVASLHLHPAFRTTWNRLRNSLDLAARPEGPPPGEAADTGEATETGPVLPEIQITETPPTPEQLPRQDLPALVIQDEHEYTLGTGATAFPPAGDGAGTAPTTGEPLPADPVPVQPPDHTRSDGSAEAAPGTDQPTPGHLDHGVRRFAAEAEAAAYGNRVLNAPGGSRRPFDLLTEAQRKAFMTYADDSVYREINQLLRSGQPVEEVESLGRLDGRFHVRKVGAHLRNIDLMDEVISRNPLPEPVEVHRGLDSVSFMHKDLEQRENPTLADLRRILTGTVQTELAYMSTTLGNELKGWDFPYHVHLTVPQGTNGFWLGQEGLPHADEREVLLEHGLSHRVTGVTQDASGRFHIDTEILPGTERTPRITATDGPPASGRAWKRLSDGTYEWGRYGIAETLVYTADTDGTLHVLLQRYGRHTHMGPSWAAPGRARDRDEESLDAAWLGFSEVTGLPPDRLAPIGSVTAYTLNRGEGQEWSRDLYLVHARTGSGLPPVEARDGESTLQWFALRKVGALKLHPHFRQAWQHIRTDGLAAASTVAGFEARARAVLGEATAARNQADALNHWLREQERPDAHRPPGRERRIERVRHSVSGFTDRAERLRAAADVLQRTADLTQSDPESTESAESGNRAETLYRGIRHLLTQGPSPAPSDGSGDGWITLPNGTRRWGRYGAAGLLLHSTAPDGTVHVLLQRRADWTDEGGTWGVPGGARDRDETYSQTALREFNEEVAGLGYTPLAEPVPHEQVLPGWKYETHLSYILGMPELAPRDSESHELRWIAVDRVGSLDLHPGFRAAWEQLRVRVTEDPQPTTGENNTPLAATPPFPAYDATSLSERFTEALRGEGHARAPEVRQPRSSPEQAQGEGRTDPGSTRHAGTDGSGAAPALTDLTEAQRNAFLDYSRDPDLRDRLRRADTLQQRLDAVEERSLRGPAWPLYEMTGLTPLTFDDVVRAHSGGIERLPAEQAELVQDIMGSPDPVLRFEELKRRSGRIASLIETFGTFPDLVGMEREFHPIG
nr:ADP-ribosyltransferase [Nocardiopsis sp. CNT312]